MPLRYIRRLTADDALGIAIATTAVTRELADCLQFPPAKAAASLLCMIFETIQSIESNRSDCYRLARRCLSLLVDIKEQMEGKWESAPESLLRSLKKFERALTAIYDFMRTEADSKWKSRLLRKTSIEGALADHNASLDDATRSFQIATLINIHYAVGDRSHSSATTSSEKADSPLPLADSSDSKFLSKSSTTVSTVSVDPGITDVFRDPLQATDVTPLSLQNLDKVSDLIDLTSPLNLTSSPIEGSDGSAVEILPPRTTSGDSFVVLDRKIEDSITVKISNAVPAAFIEELEPLEDRGFRRYHQSDIVLRGSRKSSIKKGWWAGAMDVQVDGKQAIIKRYEGGSGNEAKKKWMRDVKMLQNLFHPNLPQMVGYSNDETPTPFILLANVQTRLPQALILDHIKNASLASCAELIVRFYRDTLDAALYLQQQLNLSDSKLQDYVENANFRIDAQQTLVMGLPPPEIDRIVSYRNYGLAHSIRNVYIQLLPNRGWAQQPYDIKETSESIDYQKKISHLAILVKAVLPSSSDVSAVSKYFQKFLQEGSVDEEDEEDEELETINKTLSLRQIRTFALESEVLQHTWRNNNVEPHRYAVGDIGHIPEGGDPNTFTVLCNVLGTAGAAGMEVQHDAFGEKFSWDRGFASGKEELRPFDFPGGVKGWTIVVPPATKEQVQIVHETAFKSIPKAWRYLLDRGKTLAKTHVVKPEDLILVTKVGVDSRFYAQDLRQAPFRSPMQQQPFGHHGLRPNVPHNMHGFGGGFPGQFGHPNFPQQGFGQPFGFGQQELAPSIFYLFTSIDKDHETYWSETPFYVQLPKGAQHPEIRTRSFTGLERTYGFLNYVQLHADDFEE